MGIFSRKSKNSTPQGSGTGTTQEFIGRKFRSSASLQECLSTYAEVSAECYRTAGPMYDVPWDMPTPPPGFQPSQGTAPEISPTRMVATDLAQGGRIYLALWDGMVSYGGTSAAGGPPCEMWFVPPGFDTSPIPIAGRWKMRDNSLSSIGSVEGQLWGVADK
jgi:hypothetical protein